MQNTTGILAPEIEGQMQFLGGQNQIGLGAIFLMQSESFLQFEFCVINNLNGNSGA